MSFDCEGCVNAKEIAGLIQSSFPACRSCDELIDSWPEADPSEPGARVVYVARSALFVGICSRGHLQEFYLAEAKAGEYIAHDVTERTLGKYTPQEECPHDRTAIEEIKDGETRPADPPLVGPLRVKFCGDCGKRTPVRRVIV